MQTIIRVKQPAWLFLGLTALGIILRLSLVSLGHNFDFDSFLLVARLSQVGANIYAHTSRYNYGPVWFNLLHFFDSIAAWTSFNDRELVFRYLIALFLSFVDAGIALVLWRKLNLLAAGVFLLNPISIIITGYHNQFDNLALLLGFLSVILIGDHFDRRLERRKWLGLGVLGLSLVTKHVLFAFPFWLAVKQKGPWQKLAMLFVPVIIFFLGFLPFWEQGQQGIIQNVFLYHSHDNPIFYRLYIPYGIQLVLPAAAVWVICLVVFAVIFRKKSGFESLLFYTCIVTAASPEMANQYLAIPVPFISATMNIFSIAYTFIGTIHLLVNKSALHLNLLPQTIAGRTNGFYAILISILLLDLVWLTWREQIIILARRVFHELAVQLGAAE